ncbi:RlpA-like double-psi beta-barrel-protein domain-containing protein-containing protein [Mariannaea sp. PMI_226]|nr:RlpA-like double-psi beta-barrel-protein domain-containing protein-containing protein [Mariannaea sp. PMI_226]
MFPPKLFLLSLPTAFAFTGDVTWYNPGLGACQKTNYNWEPVAAVSAALFDTEQPCGRRIRVTSALSSVEVTVVDRCERCAYYNVDLSPSAFQQAIGELGIGRQVATWEWI